LPRSLRRRRRPRQREAMAVVKAPRLLWRLPMLLLT
jgi:hypothetical protein